MKKRLISYPIWVYIRVNIEMIFVETKLFTKHVSSYLQDGEYEELQLFLMENPDSGVVIQGTGGLRKLRWTIKNKGKRSGIRVIYYWHTMKHQIYFMTLYTKNEMSDLSAEEKKTLKSLLERW